MGALTLTPPLAIRLPGLGRAADNGGVEPLQDLEALIRRAQQGDGAAMDELLQAMRPQLEALARRYSDPARASESTSDLVQEAWLHAWQKLGQFQGGEGDGDTPAMFRAWVGRIVERLGLNRVRDRRALKRAPRGGEILRLDPGGAGASGAAGRLDPLGRGPTPNPNQRLDEEAQAVRDALASLRDPAVRDLVRLRFFEGVTLREAAERLGFTYDEARERFRSAMRHLEDRLGGSQ
jgi:RNA polymerase sigma factor (sigma-70 family)